MRVVWEGGGAKRENKEGKAWGQGKKRRGRGKKRNGVSMLSPLRAILKVNGERVKYAPVEKVFLFIFSSSSELVCTSLFIVCTP